MYRIVPLEAFENSLLPVFAVDAEGVVRYCNPAAADLDGSEPAECIGRPCWRFARFRTCDGGAFCGRDCPVLQDARSGRVPEGIPIQYARPARTPRWFQLLSFIVPPPRDGRWAVLHMLEPARVEQITACGTMAKLWREPREAQNAMPSPAQVDARLGLLTVREREVLDALAGGLEVARIAERLFISELTVRNHIQHILQRLHLHRQVDAILMVLEKHPGPPEAALG